MNPENGTSAGGSASGGTMLRMLGAAQKREVKATQNLAIIVLFFMICWIPLYTINCVIAFRKDVNIHPTFMLFCIILSHLNSAGNPLLYAYHLRDFRAALKNFLCHLFGYTDHLDHLPNPNRNSLASNNYSNTRRKLQSIKSPKNKYSFGHDTRTYHFNTSKLYYRNKTENNLPNNPNVTNIVKNSTALAVLPAGAGELSKDIWKIPECSSESSDSFKESSHDKTSMVRPATPYRIRIQSDTINHAYLDNSSLEDEFDDVFIDEEVRNEDNNQVDQIAEVKLIDTFSVSTRTKCLSTSSPQLSRNLFVVEDVRDPPSQFVRSCSLVESQKKKDPLSRESRYSVLRRLALSPIRVFKRDLCDKGISDDGSCSTDCITKKTNETLAKRCGS